MGKVWMPSALWICRYQLQRLGGSAGLQGCIAYGLYSPLMLKQTKRLKIEAWLQICRVDNCRIMNRGGVELRLEFLDSGIKLD
jgi:hypothetical protein